MEDKTTNRQPIDVRVLYVGSGARNNVFELTERYHLGSAVEIEGVGESPDTEPPCAVTRFEQAFGAGYSIRCLLVSVESPQLLSLQTLSSFHAFVSVLGGGSDAWMSEFLERRARADVWIPLVLQCDETNTDPSHLAEKYTHLPQQPVLFGRGRGVVLTLQDALIRAMGRPAFLREYQDHFSREEMVEGLDGWVRRFRERRDDPDPEEGATRRVTIRCPQGGGALGPRDFEFAGVVADQRQELIATREEAQLSVETAELVAHDLQKPLTTFANVLYLLEKGKKDPRGLRRAVDCAKRAVEGMQGLIGDLLDEGDPGRLRFLSLTEIVDDVMTRLRPHAEDRGILFRRLALPPVRGDVQRMTRLFTNLIENAIKYADTSKVQRLIEVGGRGTPQGAFLWVRDNGIGIPAAEQGKMFGKRVRASNAHGILGTGLGLHGVWRIAEEHGARVRLSSREGQGTTIYLRWSRWKEPLSGDALGQTREKKTTLNL